MQEYRLWLITSSIVIGLILLIYLQILSRRRRDRPRILLSFSLFPHIKIKGVFVMATLRKSQFKDDGGGRLVVHGHIIPETDDNQVESVENGSQKFVSSNETAATVEGDPSDDSGNKFLIVWVGPGNVQIQGTADANLKTGDDNVATVSGTLDLVLEEDQATKLELALDL